MRRLVLLVVLAFAAPAAAQDAAPAQPAPMTENPRAREQSDWKGPSGFWTNPHPAKGGAYRWRMMAVGGGFLLVTGILVLRLVKKTERDRRGP
jgi:hypothetical protein